MLNVDVINNIKTFLLVCSLCKQHDIDFNDRICVICKKKFCYNCKMIRDYTEYETRMLYCLSCHERNFV